MPCYAMLRHAVQMSASHVTDALAIAWAEAMRANERLTSLNLESNAIGSAPIFGGAYYAML